jgi:hypothetical protein
MVSALVNAGMPLVGFAPAVSPIAKGEIDVDRVTG